MTFDCKFALAHLLRRGAVTEQHRQLKRWPLASCTRLWGMFYAVRGGRLAARGSFLRRMMTRRSPLGCITPTPILSTQKAGRSVDLGSASIVYLSKRRASKAFSSFRAKCLDEKKLVSNVENIRNLLGNCFYLPSHIETPPPNGMVWFATSFPFFANLFCVKYLVGIYSSGRSWSPGSKCTTLVAHTISSPRLTVYPPNSVVSITALMDMEDVAQRRVSWIVESSNGRSAWLMKSTTFC